MPTRSFISRMGGNMFSSDRVERILGRSIVLAAVCFLAALASGLSPAPAAGEEINLTIDGIPFYASRGAVQNERLIEIDGSSIVLATWDERVSGGDFAPHYGISLDGQELVRVNQASYELGLRYAIFDPLVETPAVPTELTADAQTGLYLVQFITQPLEIFNQQIAARGGIVRHYVAQYAYLVEMTPGAREAIADLPYVRWVGQYQPAYRLEEFMLDNLEQAETVYPSQTYNLMVLTVDQKLAVADRINAIGGTVQKADAGKFMIEATLTPSQLLAAANWDQVLFIDRWGPYEEDMNIAREIGGANYIETVAGYTGAGVRGSIFDSGFNLGHVDFATRPLIEHGGAVNSSSHGSSTSGINFGDGTGDATATGMMPDGQGIVTTYQNIDIAGPSRYTNSSELVEAPYFAVFQTSSVGSPRTAQYSTISADHDQTLFEFDIVFCQSQSNAGNTQSRPQAWCKNIISGGGVRHYNTATKADDCWCGGGSTGPATDGRVKPTFTHFYDNIRTVTCCGSTSYTSSFGGTSGATPIICGHVGLFFQMWSSGIFGNPVLSDDVFANRAHMTTAKAMLVNTADQYPFVGTTQDLTRMHQGWGMPNVQNLYDLRDEIFVIDETEVLAPFETVSYPLTVASGTPELKITMAYADPPGNPAVQSQHRINDVTLKVISPTGVIYWGNNGLLQTTVSTPGGSADDKNTVENVFVLLPEAGDWTVEISADEVIQDSHLETPALDVDFALVASPVTMGTTGIESAAAPRGGLQMAILGLGPGLAGAQVSFDLQAATAVQLRIYDVQGRLVASVHEGRLPAGAQTLAWEGLDASDNPVGAGVYFARLTAGAQTATGKVLVVR